FEKTIFIDTDTYFCDNCDELFNILEYFDFLICHDYMEVTYALVNNTPLEGYRSYNSGVIAFKKSFVSQSFIEDWKKRFTSNSYIGDQPAFMESMLYSNAKIYSLQTNYNFRFNQFLTVPNGKVKILHGRHKNMAEIGKIINSRMDHRVWDPIAWTCRGWF